MQNEYTYEHTPKVPEVTKLFQIHGVWASSRDSWRR